MRSAHSPQLRSDFGDPQLVSLRESGVEAFAPSAARQRVSVALTDPVHGSGLLVKGPWGTSTVVVVWPTDDRGMVLAHRLTEARVQGWTLDERTAAKLSAIDLEFPLASHDLLVRVDGANVLGPCARSVLAELARVQPALHERIRRDSDRLVDLAIGSGSGWSSARGLSLG